MSYESVISQQYLQKLEHPLREIRIRALDNIIKKFDLNPEIDKSIQNELILKLFHWFYIEPLEEEDKVFNLLLHLLKHNRDSFSSKFGKSQIINQISDLKSKLDTKYLDKLNTLEGIIYCAPEIEKGYSSRTEVFPMKNESNKENRYWANSNHFNTNIPTPSEDCSNDWEMHNPLEDPIPFELSANMAEETIISRKPENSIKWLIMPWQPLIDEDLGILSSIERHLTNRDKENVINYCKIIVDTVLPDFPAEVFVQRPEIVTILLKILEIYGVDSLQNGKLISLVLLTLFKITRALRLRINIYCDPNIASRMHAVLNRINDSLNDNIDSLSRTSRETFRNKNPSVLKNLHAVHDSALQLQQLFLPNYCTETLFYALKLIHSNNNESRPLNIIKFIADLVYELICLLKITISPSIWFCDSSISLEIRKNLENLFQFFSEILDYFDQYNHIGSYRAIYLYFLFISIQLISNLVPLEIADSVIPKSFKLSLCCTVMDAVIYFLYPETHTTILNYARQFSGQEEIEFIKLFDETRFIAKSMKAAIALIKETNSYDYSKQLAIIHSSKFCLSYHKHFKIIRLFIDLAQNTSGYALSTADETNITNMILALLANCDTDIQIYTYKEIYNLIKAVLGIEYNPQYSWKHIIFLMNPDILSEIICHGTTNDNVKCFADDTLLLLLKGKIQLTDSGWIKFLEALLPVLPLLQCLADYSTPLGNAIIKFLDPDLASELKISPSEVLRGNTRFLFSPHADIRTEAVRRIIYLFNESKKYPPLSFSRNMSFHSLCIFENTPISSRSPSGFYQKSSLDSIIEMLKTSNIEPKMRKSALNQICVMLSDLSLRKIFADEYGVDFILDIFSNALTESNCDYYLDCIIPLVTILRDLISLESKLRIQLTENMVLYNNILRSLFLYSTNTGFRRECAQILGLLTYSGFIMRCQTNVAQLHFNISLPHIIYTKMMLPFTCKTHWKTSIHRRSEFLHRNNPIAQKFLRHYWAWEYDGKEKLFTKAYNDLDAPIRENLKITEVDYQCLLHSYLFSCLQQQLHNIQNAISHTTVLCALDYLRIYLRIYTLTNSSANQSFDQLPWAKTFERFLQAYPTNSEDDTTFAEVLNFLSVYLKVMKDYCDCQWLHKSVKKLTKTLSTWLQDYESTKEQIVHSFLKLIRNCVIIDPIHNTKDTWVYLIEYAISNLSYGQEFYSLASVNWLISTLVYVTGKCDWRGQDELLGIYGNTSIELIEKFCNNGAEGSFMCMGILRNSFLVLNDVLDKLKTTFDKNSWLKFWFRDNRNLEWVILLLKWRDPFIRASALHLFTGLISGPHTESQLLTSIRLSSYDLCMSIFFTMVNQEESSLVKEEASLALSQIVKNSNNSICLYGEPLNPPGLITLLSESNIYEEINLICAKMYILPTLDPDLSEDIRNKYLRCSTTNKNFLRNIYEFYHCHESIQENPSHQGLDSNDFEFISTPSLITALCSLLNNLIILGDINVVDEIYERSVHKYLLSCIGSIPNFVNTKETIENYHDILEMYASICSVLTNCITSSPSFASKVAFSSDVICLMLKFINKKSYPESSQSINSVRNNLEKEVFNFLCSLSLTENQHASIIQNAFKTCNPEILLYSVASIINHSTSDFGMSAINFLEFILSLEIQKTYQGDDDLFLNDILDMKLNFLTTEQESSEDKNINPPNKDILLGSDLCNSLFNRFVALTHAKCNPNSKVIQKKDSTLKTLTNLLFVSKKAREFAVQNNLPQKLVNFLLQYCMSILSLPMQEFKIIKSRNTKVHPLLQEVDNIFSLLIFFMYDSAVVKILLAKASLLDVVHKLWTYIILYKSCLYITLRMLATFTAYCAEASRYLIMTSTVPGASLRKNLNNFALLHVLVQFVCKEIDSVNRNSADSQIIQMGFTVLQNALANADCRVAIGKTNILKNLSKLHPNLTKRTKPWRAVEFAFLNFLMDYSYYDEGQLLIPKAHDSLEVLIALAEVSRDVTSSQAISIIRNLSFNILNRPRLLNSTAYINLLLGIFKNGSVAEIRLAVSAIWALISNNQRGKMIARNAGFPDAIESAVCRLSLMPTFELEQGEDFIEMIEYVRKIITP